MEPPIKLMQEQDSLWKSLKLVIEDSTNLDDVHPTEEQMAVYRLRGASGESGEFYKHVVLRHLTECAECRAGFKDVLDFFGPLRPGEENTSDLELRRIWSRILDRLPHGPAFPASTAESLDVLGKRKSGGNLLVLALAASLVLTLALGSVWVMRLRNHQGDLTAQLQTERESYLARLSQAEQENDRIRAQAELEKKENAELTTKSKKDQEPPPKDSVGTLAAVSPEVNVPIYDVFSIQDVQRSAGEARPNEIKLPQQASTFVLILNGDGLAAKNRSYQVEIVNPAGNVTWRGAGLKQDGTGNFTLLLPASIATPGTHKIALYDRSGASSKPIAEYTISIQR